ncbi:uncharacterized protein B0H18DRAFT_475008 [Fomitopsis serialis]|uniref:uncharacterized protein n=1 Tax=Fomitopsis serialis TaxID=139415 RepID=UPI002008D56B|nr:uncharacterized protein B0H18DRAFT_475008 [Neoantrodia serialis]KAH9923290.1 hypothetical protein B0H18DRAFT_475008 [Neoantrodia serialis]
MTQARCGWNFWQDHNGRPAGSIPQAPATTNVSSGARGCIERTDGSPQPEDDARGRIVRTDAPAQGGARGRVLRADALTQAARRQKPAPDTVRVTSALTSLRIFPCTVSLFRRRSPVDKICSGGLVVEEDDRHNEILVKPASEVVNVSGLRLSRRRRRGPAAPNIAAGCVAHAHTRT